MKRIIFLIVLFMLVFLPSIVSAVSIDSFEDGVFTDTWDTLPLYPKDEYKFELVNGDTAFSGDYFLSSFDFSTGNSWRPSDFYLKDSWDTPLAHVDAPVYRPDTMSFYYYEFSNSNGGGVRIWDSDSNAIVYAGTENPNPHVKETDQYAGTDKFNNSNYNISGKNLRDNDYQFWMKVTFNFKWKDTNPDSVDITFKMADGDTSTTYENAYMDNSNDTIQRISIDSNNGNQDELDPGDFNCCGDDYKMLYDLFSMEGATVKTTSSNTSSNSSQIYEYIFDPELGYKHGKN